MRIVETKRELREALAPARREERTIGLVPTMGYLHDGHVALIEAARSDCDVVVMSLFVNPAQFGPGEDLESYPATATATSRSPKRPASISSTRRPSRRRTRPASRRRSRSRS